MSKRRGTRVAAPSRGRTARQQLGQRAEDLVAARLSSLGWRILGRNVRVGRYELDLVALDGSTVVVIEVRLRGSSSWTTPLGSIDASKRARLRNAAHSIWRTWFRDRPEIDRLRFDVAAVHFDPSGQPVIELVRAAFA
jgi:putative endonuclease